jgi:hypothetical protein
MVVGAYRALRCVIVPELCRSRASMAGLRLGSVTDGGRGEESNLPGTDAVVPLVIPPRLDRTRQDSTTWTTHLT